MAATPLREFPDTEFTRMHWPALISVGLVAEDSRKFYAELTDDWDRADCSL